jgi:hypothetical protein
MVFKHEPTSVCRGWSVQILLMTPFISKVIGMFEWASASKTLDCLDTSTVVYRMWVDLTIQLCLKFDELRPATRCA